MVLRVTRVTFFKRVMTHLEVAVLRKLRELEKEQVQEAASLRAEIEELREENARLQGRGRSLVKL